MYKARAFASKSAIPKPKRDLGEIFWPNCPRSGTDVSATRNRDHKKISPIPTLTKINTAGWIPRGKLSHSKLNAERPAALPSKIRIDQLCLGMFHQVFRAQKVVHPTVELMFPMFQLPMLMTPPTPHVLTVASPAQGIKTGARYGSEATMSPHTPVPMIGPEMATHFSFFFN
jgi:hypothetical protein